MGDVILALLAGLGRFLAFLLSILRPVSFEIRVPKHRFRVRIIRALSTPESRQRSMDSWLRWPFAADVPYRMEQAEWRKGVWICGVWAGDTAINDQLVQIEVIANLPNLMNLDSLLSASKRRLFPL